MTFFLRIAAVVIFILAALLVLLGDTTTVKVIGMTDVGLAAWVASTIIP